ncbi:unnamed protein product [Paramecium sonneborni]|uniref:Papain family cysteine protease n=1 Tax=Paramecium sonneborni TaxID=65129 RepID=A0A8S1R6Z6_9CILI|nr:unnamed protein product [Paramecium sonneborni]
MQKGLLTILAITILAGTGLLMNSQSQEQNSFLEDKLMKEYQIWQQEHGKRYSQFENTFRFGIFKKNYDYVINHQKRFEAGLETYELGMNSLADLSVEEFEGIYLKWRYNNKQQSNEIFEGGKGIQIPEFVDLRNDGLVSAVQNQGNCGSCWAFSAVGSLESALRQSGVQNVELSEQELNDCTKGQEYDSDGCNGGFMFEAFEYASKNGIAIKSEYTYVAQDQECQSKKTKTRFTFNGYIRVESLNSQAYLEAASQHALSVGINASGINFQLYRKGIFSSKCDGKVESLNHAILNVGYAPDYYLLKNSWGLSWGEAGFIRFARITDKVGQCGVHQDVTYPIYKKNSSIIQ